MTQSSKRTPEPTKQIASRRKTQRPTRGDVGKRQRLLGSTIERTTFAIYRRSSQPERSSNEANHRPQADQNMGQTAKCDFR